MGTNSNLISVSCGESAHFVLGYERWADARGRTCLGIREVRETTVDYRAFKERKKKEEKGGRELFQSRYSKYLTTFSAKAQTTEWTWAINNQ